MPGRLTAPIRLTLNCRIFRSETDTSLTPVVAQHLIAHQRPCLGQRTSPERDLPGAGYDEVAHRIDDQIVLLVVGRRNGHRQLIVRAEHILLGVDGLFEKARGLQRALARLADRVGIVGSGIACRTGGAWSLAGDAGLGQKRDRSATEKDREEQKLENAANGTRDRFSRNRLVWISHYGNCAYAKIAGGLKA